jgi:hypothetical protein
MRFLGKAIPKRDTLVAGSQIDDERGVAAISEYQTAIVQNVVNSRDNSAKQLIGFMPTLICSRILKDKTARKRLIIATDAKR